MKKPNNSDALSSVRLNRGNAFLLALHVLVVVISVYIHPIIETSACRALP